MNRHHLVMALILILIIMSACGITKSEPMEQSKTISDSTDLEKANVAKKDSEKASKEEKSTTKQEEKDKPITNKKDKQPESAAKEKSNQQKKPPT